MTLKIKDFCTYEQLLDILRRRGLIIHDEAIALRHLREKNYYRLSAYSLTLRSYNLVLVRTIFMQVHPLMIL